MIVTVNTAGGLPIPARAPVENANAYHVVPSVLPSK